MTITWDDCLFDGFRSSMLAATACQTWSVEHPHDRAPQRPPERARRLESARLYLVCDGQDERFLEAVLRGGVDIVQLRLKNAGDGELVSTGRRFARVCAAHGALFILNDRPDLVADAAADGVHVGQDDMPVAEARALVGRKRLVGLSTHSQAQVDAAGVGERPDYIGVGPVYETPTKPGRAAVGLELVRYASARATVPFFAIGGIDEGTVGGVVAAGARRIAVVRALVGAPDPEGAAQRLGHALATKRAAVGAA
jgi:thiamine-phosphate pyrophosphorylase